MPDGEESRIPLLLRRAGDGEAEAREELYLHLQRVLRERASLAEPPDPDSLSTSTLLASALEPIAPDPGRERTERREFFLAAARAVRAVLVEHATEGRSGAGRGAAPLLDRLAASYAERALDLLRLDAALSRLSSVDAVAADVVSLHFFAGLPLSRVARILGVPESRAADDFDFARAWLAGELR